VLLEAVPEGCECALDVGCGEGVFARELRRRVPYVAAIDVDPRCIDLARAQDPGGEIDYRVGDFLHEPFAPSSFDFVACVTALHHMDAPAALRRMAELVRHGRSSRPRAQRPAA
jgi:2-polyprenyl-3-methyl-5-hydroxy-6-metoxy-1,4-benzoquinol methylase